MTSAEFQNQMNRLAETFGKGAYGKERVQLIWSEVKDFDFEWMRRVVDRWIGELRQAPLMAEFRDEISKERERRYKREKDKNTSDAKAFMRSVFSDDDKKLFIQTIIKRIGGGVSDDAWTGFLDIVHKTVKHTGARPACSMCEDSGYVFWKEGEYEYARDCDCRILRKEGASKGRGIA